MIIFKVSLNKNKDSEGKEKVCGARVRDEITGREWDVKAKCVINATGPFTDAIRKMDNQSVGNICAPSAGVHIVLPGYYSPESMGLLDPSTSDGRVIFFLPWQVSNRLEQSSCQLLEYLGTLLFQTYLGSHHCWNHGYAVRSDSQSEPDRGRH